MINWKDVEIELPPKDGNYFVKNKGSPFLEGICFYDGYGFMYDGKYVNPEMWREMEPRVKKYGKVKCE